MNKKQVLLLGATGLVGSNVLRESLESDLVGNVTVLVRKPLAISNSKLIQVVTDFSDWSALDTLTSVDVLFCCIGTTRKKTPDLVQYKAIDYGITMEVARRAKQLGCKQIHLISSVGANAKSSNFYLKIKGQTEEGIQTLGFETCLIYRPSMLIGKRNESRPAEKIGQILTPVFDFFTFGGNYHSIRASELAQCMVGQVERSTPGKQILYYRDFNA
jgi:uncharacterized protein YbjT (DUF2867 family)